MGKEVNIIIGSDHLGKDFPEKLQDLFPEVHFIKAFSEKEQLNHIQKADVYFGFPSKEILPPLLAFPSIDSDAWTLILAPLLTFVVTFLDSNL